MIDICQAKPEDLDFIFASTLSLHYHEDDGDLKSHAQFEQNLKRWLSLEMENPNSLFLTAKIDQSPVGFICASSMVNDNGLLEASLKGLVSLLWVEPEFRGKNIASMLLNKTESCLKEIGVSYIECSYTDNNELAKNFWSKQGYFARSVTARKVLRD